MNIYGWKEGGHPYRRLDAQDVGNYLAGLAERDELTPQGVLQAARDPKSPIHSLFEWNDSKAAEQHRLAQARTLIGCVTLIKNEIHPREPTRAFVLIRHAEEPHKEYKPVQVVLRAPKLRQQVLEQALKEITWFQRKYAILEEILSEIQAIKEKLEKLIEQVQEPPAEA